MRPLPSAGLKAGVVAGAGAALLALLGPSAKYPLQAMATAASDVYVAVVVDFGGLSGAPSQPVATCAEVPSGSTMADALAVAAKQIASEYPVPNGGLGWASTGLLCQIDGLPTSQQVSNCDSTVNGKYQYWSFWTANSSSWLYAQVGPASVLAGQGAVEGYRFELSGAGNSTDPPPGTSPDFARICAGTPPSASPTTTAASPTTTTKAVPVSQAPVGGGPTTTGGTPPTTAAAAGTTQAAGTTSSTVDALTGSSSTGSIVTTTTAARRANATAAGGGGGSKLEFAGVGALVLLLAAGAGLRFRKGAA